MIKETWKTKCLSLWFQMTQVCGDREEQKYDSRNNWELTSWTRNWRQREHTENGKSHLNKKIHPQKHTSLNKATPPNPSQFHQPESKYSTIWASASPLIHTTTVGHANIVTIPNQSPDNFQYMKTNHSQRHEQLWSGSFWLCYVMQIHVMFYWSRLIWCLERV